MLCASGGSGVLHFEKIYYPVYVKYIDYLLIINNADEKLLNTVRLYSQ